ncbi:MAG: tRNA (adenosine(37)-N6)-dimethylallyltransferase MiaA [Bacillota bacterium]|nr:tRNA (adenosine(37)-N6)-dimethylallyltransferase MiaA [Bacillota bacterium]
MTSGKRILVICGPTAVGKTEYAIEAACHFGGEVVSCDSMQIYKYMDIGSAKPTPEEMARATHHLVDFVDPREEFSVADYQMIARQTVDDILGRGKLPVISGGTGLYLNALIYDMDFASAPKDTAYRNHLHEIAQLEGSSALHEMLRSQDPDAAERIHENNTKKLIRALERLHEGEGRVQPFSDVNQLWEAYDPLIVGLLRERNELYERIDRRVEKLVDEGLVEEVSRLMAMGLTSEDISMKGIGYKEIIDYLDGRYSLEEAVAKVQKNTRHYAKRQLTWFRRYDKINWYDITACGDEDKALEDYIEWLKVKL